MNTATDRYRTTTAQLQDAQESLLGGAERREEAASVASGCRGGEARGRSEIGRDDVRDMRGPGGFAGALALRARVLRSLPRRAAGKGS